MWTATRDNRMLNGQRGIRLLINGQTCLKLLLSFAVVATFIHAMTVESRADVRVWTDREDVIIKGNLRGIEIVPGSKGKANPKLPTTPKTDLPSKPRSKWKRKKRKGRRTAPSQPRLAQVLKVGPGKRYKRPSHAAKAARDGDTIEIAAGEYVDCAVWRASNLTIRGIGGRAHVRDRTCKGKAIWIIRGTNTRIENIEFSGMRVRDRNGAGIRHQGAGLTIRNAYFHDGEQGILGGGKKPNDAIVIENSKFARLGGNNGRSHAMYISRAETLTVRNSSFYDCGKQGHCLKSRAKRTILICNLVASLEGDSSYEIDIPEGGYAEIRGNVIEQGPKSVNRRIVAFAAESRNPKRRHANQTLIFERNMVINDRPDGAFFFIRKHAGTVLRVRHNTFIGRGALDHVAGNKRFHNRKAAGLAPYPALPKPCAGNKQPG